MEGGPWDPRGLRLRMPAEAAAAAGQLESLPEDVGHLRSEVKPPRLFQKIAAKVWMSCHSV